jgi:hypothetical protein
MVHQIFSDIFIPIISGIVIKDLTPTSATLFLPFPETPPKNYPLLFEGRFKPNAATELEREWTPMQYDAPMRDSFGRFVYRIRGLEPGSTLTLRILGPLLQDGTRQPLHQQELRVPRPPPTLWKRNLLLGGLLAAVMAFWIRVRRNA